MAPTEGMRGPSPSSPEPGRPADIRLTADDRRALLRQLAEVFHTAAEAGRVLDLIDYPASRRQQWTDDAETMWAEILRRLGAGIIEQPWRRLLTVALELYPNNDVFRAIGNRHGIRGAAATVGANDAADEAGEVDTSDHEQPGDQPPDETTCHVIVAAGTDAERAAARNTLQEAALEPAECWSTPNAISYRVASDNTDQVRVALVNLRQDWIIVAPGLPDYLFDTLFVQGPDGRRLRLRHAPAQQTVEDLGAAVVNAQYGDVPGRNRAFVVDLQQDDGANQRLAPDQTLHGAGVRDGDTVRIGFEATAGTVNPLVYREALQRMRNQILEFAKQHGGITVSGQPAVLPTQYEIGFNQPGFGPPLEPGGEPVAIEQHRVLIQLYGDFPLTAPLVFWLTDIFHPNISPNYDSKLYREKPTQRGQVCLGALMVSYTPALDFGELCQTLIDMAGYRNYTVLEPVEGLGRDQVEMLHLDYVDEDAAKWAWHHQKEIKDIGGRPVLRAPKERSGTWNVIEEEDGEEDEA